MASRGVWPSWRELGDAWCAAAPCHARESAGLRGSLQGPPWPAQHLTGRRSGHSAPPMMAPLGAAPSCFFVSSCISGTSLASCCFQGCNVCRRGGRDGVAGWVQWRRAGVLLGPLRLQAAVARAG